MIYEHVSSILTAVHYDKFFTVSGGIINSFESWSKGLDFFLLSLIY